MRKYFNCHNHTMYSNLRLLDSINRPKDLIYKARELGLSGIAITDHECLSGSVEINMYAEEIRKKHPDFKVGLGNEIYLCGNRGTQQDYYHFILIAKDKIGHKQLRRLSSRAWMLSFHDRGMERVVTTYDELTAIIKEEPGHLIATTACIGGELSKTTLALCEAELMDNQLGAKKAHQHIVNFVLWCKEVFGADFYIEVAPATGKEQIVVNTRLAAIAKAFDRK